MKKFLAKLGLFSAAIAAAFTLSVGIAHGAGETYYFSNEARTEITGQGGGFGSEKFSFKKGSDPSFTSVVTYPCTDTAATGSIEMTLAISQADYDAKKDVTPAKVSLNNDTVQGCVSPSYDATTQVAASIENSTASSVERNNEACNQGSFSWFACPLVDTVTSGITSLATDFLTPLLAVQPLTKETAPDLYRAWEGVRVLANILFVFAFLFIVLAHSTSFGLDQYTAKKMLPRLVVATILVQFSFLISAFIIDLGNILGYGIQDFFLNFFNTTTSPHGDTQQAQNILIILGIAGFLAIGNFLNWIFVIPILIGLLAGIIGFFIIMAVRFFLLAFLVVLSPLAFFAWVLPNTEGYYRVWYRLFTRLIMMFPIIMLILAIAGRINQILTFAGGVGGNQITTNGSYYTSNVSELSAGGMNLVLTLMRPLLAIAVFFLILQTFKWAGGVLALIEGRTKGGLHDRMVNKLRNSEYYKERVDLRNRRQESMNNRLAATSTIKGLKSSRSPIKRGAGSMLLGSATVVTGGGPASAKSRARVFSAGMRKDSKELEELLEGNNMDNLRNIYRAPLETDPIKRRKYMDALLSKGESVFEYSQTSEGRIAAVNRLAGMKQFKIDDHNFFLNVAKEAERQGKPLPYEEYFRAMKVAGQEFAELPTIVLRHQEKGVKEEFKDPYGRVLGNITDRSGNVLVSTERQIGDPNVTVLGNILSGKGAGALNKMDRDNFVLMADDASIALAASMRISPSAIDEMYKPGRNFADQNKRADLVKMLANQAEIMRPSWNTNAHQIKHVILDNLENQTDILGVLAKDVAGLAPSRVEDLVNRGEWRELSDAVRNEIESRWM